MRREVPRLKAEREVVKKPPLLREVLDMKFRFIA
jgi:hypothetical protein